MFRNPSPPPVTLRAGTGVKSAKQCGESGGSSTVSPPRFCRLSGPRVSAGQASHVSGRQVTVELLLDAFMRTRRRPTGLPSLRNRSHLEHLDQDPHLPQRGCTIARTTAGADEEDLAAALPPPIVGVPSVIPTTRAPPRRSRAPSDTLRSRTAPRPGTAACAARRTTRQELRARRRPGRLGCCRTDRRPQARSCLRRRCRPRRRSRRRCADTPLDAPHALSLPTRKLGARQPSLSPQRSMSVIGPALSIPAW